jgi:hypothetical protein
MLHYTYPTISDFLKKLDRYTRWEAEERQKLAQKYPAHVDRSGGLTVRGVLRSIRRMCPGAILPSLVFLYMFVWCGGFRDGRHGWVLSNLYAYQEFLVNVKLWEQKQH